MAESVMGKTTDDRLSGARTIADSHVQLSQFMSPGHANSQGNVHGGEIMKLVDEAGALAAMRHSRSHVVTVAMDSMTFMEPIYVGNVVILEAELTYVGHTSMEVGVKVLSENPRTGDTRHTSSAYTTFVAIDDHGNPVAIPPLLLETDEDRRRNEQARLRREHRLSKRPKGEGRGGNS